MLYPLSRTAFLEQFPVAFARRRNVLAARRTMIWGFFLQTFPVGVPIRPTLFPFFFGGIRHAGVGILLFAFVTCALGDGYSFGKNSEKIQNYQSNNENQSLQRKRDAGDQTGLEDKGTVTTQSGFQPIHYRDNQYSTIGQYGQYVSAAATPQVVYAKPVSNIQYSSPPAASSYRVAAAAAYPAQSAQIAYAVAPQPGVKYAQPNYAQVQVAYAQPATPVHYAAIAIGAPGGHGAYQPVAYATPIHGHHGYQIAIAPYHHAGASAAQQYYSHAVPQLAAIAPHSNAVSSSKYAQVSAPVIAQPQPQLYHQPYAYTIHPSIQIASAKQVLAPTVATPQYRQYSSPVQHPQDGATSYATYSQYLGSHSPTSGVSPVKVAQVVAQPVYSTSAYPGKSAYSSAGHIAASPSEPIGAIQYATAPYFQPASAALAKIHTVPNFQKYTYAN